MCKKSLLPLLLVLPLLLSCGNPPRRAEAVREERHIPELIAAVPSDALAVICHDHCSEGMRLLDSANVLHRLDLSEFKNARMALSLCFNGSLVPVLALDAGRAEADSASAINGLLEQAAALKLQAEYIHPDLEAKRRGFVLITPSDAQLTAVRRHLTEYSSILDAPGFRQALLAADSENFLIFRGGGAPERLAPKGWMQGIFPRRELTAFLGSVADWTVLIPETGGFSVKPVCGGEGDSFFANILGTLPFGDSRLGEILPQEVRFALALPVSLPKLREAVERWQDATVKLTRYKGRLDELRKASGKNPLNWEKEVGVQEIALVHFDGGAVVLVRPAKPAADSEPADNPLRGFLPALYGNAFALDDDSCTACAFGWQVYGSPGAVGAFLAAERPEKPADWPGRGCRFLIHQPGKTLAWGKKGIKLTWNSNQ